MLGSVLISATANSEIDGPAATPTFITVGRCRRGVQFRLFFIRSGVAGLSRRHTYWIEYIFL